MNDWSTLFLAVTEVAKGRMAPIQISVLIYGARLVRLWIDSRAVYSGRLTHCLGR